MATEPRSPEQIAQALDASADERCKYFDTWEQSCVERLPIVMNWCPTCRNREAARALRRLQALEQWQPIKTCPRGKRVLLYYPPWRMRPELIDAGYLAGHRKPTHWIPLPAPPSDPAQPKE